MSEILDGHLYAVSKSMGKFLRGFDDPQVHLGSTDLFVREFRKVLDYPGLHLTGYTGIIAYSEAVTSCRVPQNAARTESDTPLSVMVGGLIRSPFPSAEARHELRPDELRQDLSALLRLPAMLFYIQVSNTEAFFVELEKIAKQGSFPLMCGGLKSPSASARCPACGAILPSGPHRRMLQCGSCGRMLETVRPLAMVSGAAALISYEMLRKVVTLNLVLSYQEEGIIRPQQAGSEIQ